MKKRKRKQRWGVLPGFFGCAPEDVIQMVETLSGEKTPRIIGVCFMNVFERAACAGWDEKLNFDTMIDTTMESSVK